MAPRRVVYSPAARRDLEDLYDYIADRASPQIAFTYLSRIEANCLDFADFPERGTRRDDLEPGLRIVGFERRVTIAFHVSETAVTIDRIFYGGRDFGRAY